MALTSTQRTDLETRKATLTSQLAGINTALSAGNEVGEYRFDSGEGRQQVKYRSLAELLDAIHRIEIEIRRIDQRLAGQGITNMELARRG